MNADAADKGAAQLRVLSEVASWPPEDHNGSAVVAGLREIAQRVLHKLEAGEVSVALLPSKVADLVFVALGSSSAEHEDEARRIARQFRNDVIAAVQASATKALSSLTPKPELAGSTS